MLSTTPTNALTLSSIGSISLSGAEISAYDPASDRFYVTTANGLVVVNAANPASMSVITTILPTANGVVGNDIQSVAFSNGLIAAAVRNPDKVAPGEVAFYTAATGAFVGKVTVGANPDMLTFTPDGTRLLVANEGELRTPNASAIGPVDNDGVTDTNIDPEGSVSIITIAGTTLAGGTAAPSVATAGFTSFIGQEAALRASGVRVFEGKTVAEDMEPEYIAISANSARAMVTLQENNAVGLLDLATNTFTAIVPLGSKDFSTLMADFSDRDGPSNGTATRLETGNPVFGLYMPDAISSYSANGQTYYVIANEGDDRDDFINPDETIRVGNSAYDLDNTRFPTETALKANAELGRLTVSNAPGLRGDTDGDGDVDQILAYGGRSFSILDANGRMVFDSADIIERVTAGLGGTAFDDTRSDNKAAEPEGVTIGQVGGRTYAFVGLERSHATMVFDVTNPAAVSYTNFAARAGDLNPEGLTFIKASDSPTGKALLATTNEASNTLTVFEASTTIDYTLQLLHFSDAEAGLLAPTTAPYLAALVDAFDQSYANTLILAGGDNWIPGPFLAGGTDASVRTVFNQVTGSNVTGNMPIAAVDIAIHNLIGVEASALGNHDFDLGSNVLNDSLRANAGWVGANFPSVSANLVFGAASPYQGNPTVAPNDILNGIYTDTLDFNANPALNAAPTTTLIPDASTLKGRIVPAAVVNEGGQKIGLVGATTQILETISSPTDAEVAGFPGGPGANGEADNMALLAAQLQPVIDEMRAEGINKIILLSHLQVLNNERTLATLLNGVDIILSAGSNTRLGDANDVAVAFPGHSANFADTYPIVTQGADGKPTLIVNTDNEFTYLGRLVVDFDANGDLITANLPGMSTVNGAYAATAANAAAAWGVSEANLLTSAAFAEGTKAEQVQDLTDAVQGVISAKDGNVAGRTSVYLEGERSFVRNQETNLGNLTADANAYVADQAIAEQTFIVSVKNGGGIRAQIGTISLPDPITGSVTKLPPPANAAANKPEGGVSQLDIENSLRFNNGLMAFDTTAQGLKAILEHGVAVLGNQGRFPQIGGVAFSFDKDLPASNRVSDIALLNADGTVAVKLYEDGALLGNLPSKITVVALNFLANGGDGYPMKANGENFRFLLNDGTLSGPVDEALNYTATGVVPANIMGEQQALTQFMQAFHSTPATAFNKADTTQAEDTRIQNLDFRNEAFAGVVRNGGPNGDTLNGTGGDDQFYGEGGNDTMNGDAGNDMLFGGAGADVHNGGAGFDYARYDNSAEGITVSLANPSINTGIAVGDTYSGIEALVGTAFNDALFGDGMTNQLFGADGIDQLTGGAGADYLDGGRGFDYARYDSAATGVTASLANPASNTGDAAGDRYIAIEALVGSALNDTLSGDTGNNQLWGGSGEDQLLGGAGNDDLYGWDGQDFLIGGAGGDRLDGGDGFDMALYSDATSGVYARLDFQSANTGDAAFDQIFGIEGLAGSQFNDVLVGDINANFLNGLGGTDALFGNAGSDVLTGGGATDYFAWFGTDFRRGEFDTVTDFSEAAGEADVLVLFGINMSELQMLDFNGGVAITTSAIGFGPNGGGIFIENFSVARLQDQLVLI